MTEYHTENFQTFLDKIEATVGTPHRVEGCLRSSVRAGAKDFTGTDSLQEAIQVARYGWPETCRYLLATSAEISKAVNVTKITYRHDVAGSYPDIERYLSGEPENMVEILSGRDDQTMDIYVEGGYSGSTPRSEILNRGAAIVSIVKQIEESGYGVNLYVHFGSGKSRGASISLCLQIKDANTDLDIDRVGFVCCHPSMLRRMAFAYKEMYSADPIALGAYRDGGYGTPMTSEELGRDFPNTLGHDGQYYSVESAKEWVEKCIKSWGINK